MKTETILKKTKGKKLFTCNSWNGSSMTITVEAVERLTDCYLFKGVNHWGGKSGIYVNADHIGELLKNGSAEHHNQVERCDVVTKWTLNDAKQ